MAEHQSLMLSHERQSAQMLNDRVLIIVKFT